jgi:hypothetical protein
LGIIQSITVFLQRYVAVLLALSALNTQVVNVGLQRTHRLLAALPGGADFIQIRL